MAMLVTAFLAANPTRDHVAAKASAVRVAVGCATNLSSGVIFQVAHPGHVAHAAEHRANELSSLRDKLNDKLERSHFAKVQVRARANTSSFDPIN